MINFLLGTSMDEAQYWFDVNGEPYESWQPVSFLFEIDRFQGFQYDVLDSFAGIDPGEAVKMLKYAERYGTRFEETDDYNPSTEELFLDEHSCECETSLLMVKGCQCGGF